MAGKPSRRDGLRMASRRSCAQRRHGGGEDRAGPGSPPESQTHRQIDGRAFCEYSDGARRLAQGGAAGGVNADPVLDKLTTIFAASTIESTNGGSPTHCE